MKIINKITKIILLTMLFTSSMSTFAKNAEFPGRDRYPKTAFIGITDFQKIKDKVIIVDVRSAYEHQTLRIKGALNVSISSKDYVKNMRKLRSDNPAKKIIVYCNGKTCMKSYKAAKRCRQNGIKNVVSYDAGIMDWAKKYPADAVLLGKNPIDPKNIISKKVFKTYLIKPEKFEQMLSKQVLVLDVRDSFQRDGTGLFAGKERNISINDVSALSKYIAQVNKQGQTLLIYDAVGKQVRWLQYLLEAKKAKSYFFMKGGAKGYYQYISKKYMK